MNIQVIIGLILIVGVAAVALACDFLRARNAQLRNAMAQMKARQAGQGSGPKPTGPKRTVAKSTRLPAAEFTAQSRRKPQVGSSPALSAWLAARAPESEPARALALVPPPETQKPIMIDAQLWAPAPVQPRQGLELVRATGPSNVEVRLPAGMYPSAGLSQLLESSQLFTGLAISIGASLADTVETGQSAESLIAELLRANDFGCRTTEDEFVLLCPGLHGAEAQRHLSHVSECLWDYQLRTLGQFSIMFSLGGIEVQHESLSGSVASAQERMGQIKRPRTRSIAQQRKAG